MKGAAAILFGGACAALLREPWHGAVVLSISETHGIDVGDLPALALVALSVAIVHTRAQAWDTPAAVRWLTGRWAAVASAVVLGALLLLVGPVDTFSPRSLVPAGGGTFDGSIQYTDGRHADPLDRWTHVAVTYDGGTLRLYVDGTQVSSRAMTGRIQKTTDPLWMGRNRPYGEPFQGVLDEVQVYDRALDPSEVRNAMSTPIANRAGSSDAGLVGAYGFDAGSGTVVADASGKGNAGVITGATWTTEGRFGDGMRFDDDGDVVRIPASASLDLNDAMTLSAWIRPSESHSGWRTILHRQTDAYFLTAGGGAEHENRLATLDDARLGLAVLVAIWLCVALALGPSRWVGGRQAWWLPIALFLAGSVIDGVLAPADSLVGPALVAIWCARIAPHRGETAIFYLIAAAFTALTVVSLAAPDGISLANDGAATARAMAYGLLLVIIGLLAARHGRAALRSTRTC